MKFALDDFYQSSVNPQRYESKSSELKPPSPQSYYVFLCFFFELIKNGAIYISGDTNNPKLLVDKASFTSCKSTSDGGSLFFSSTTGECVQSKICSFGSNVNSLDTYGAYSKTIVSTNTGSKNYVEESTISSAGNINNYGYGTIFFNSGDVIMKSNNISKNNIYNDAFYYVTNGNSNFNNSFSTFSNNTCTSSWSADHFGSDKYIYFCNIFHNKGTGGLIGSSSNTILYNCSFINNVMSGAYLHGSPMTCYNCYIDQQSFSSYRLTLINRISSEFRNSLSHISTGLCEADFPLIYSIDQVKSKEEIYINFHFMPFIIC